MNERAARHQPIKATNERAVHARRSEPATTLARAVVARHAIAVACLIGVAMSLVACGPPPPPAPEPDAWVTIGRARVATEIARDPAQKARGLGRRDALAWDHGMLFPYARPDFLSFWMKDMRFSIDIVWIREGRIVDIAHRVPFDPAGGPGPTVRPRELADSVLEVPAGYAQAQGWRRGDRVEVVERKAPDRREGVENASP